MAAAPYTSGERAVAALQLLQTLHGRIHRALGAAWATEVPFLLQYLEGKVRVGKERLSGKMQLPIMMEGNCPQFPSTCSAAFALRGRQC